MRKSLDSDYELYLKSDYHFQGTNTDIEENEPQYEIFLNSLKLDGNAWVIQADERNGLPENRQMEDVSDDRPDRDIRRDTMNVIDDTVEGIRPNSFHPDIGSLHKKPRTTLVENGMNPSCSGSINAIPFEVEQNLDGDSDISIHRTSSCLRNNEKLPGSGEKCNGKNVRTSAKATKGGELKSFGNLVGLDGDYQFFVKNFFHDEDGEICTLTCSVNGNPKARAATIPCRSDGGEGDDDCICLGSPSGEGNSSFREQLMKILRKPYNKEEHQSLARDIKATKPIKRNMELRHGREQSYSYSTNKMGKSYLDGHPDLKRKVEAATDCRQELALLRGFFFWLQNGPPNGAFIPWLDEEFLALLPGDQ